MFIFMIIILTALLGCTLHQTKGISDRLQVGDLYELYGVRPLNLKARSNCPLPSAINIINMEKREEEIVIFHGGGLFPRTVNPKELTTAFVEYLKYGFEKSQIKIDNSSSKTIQISLENAEFINTLGSLGGVIKMKVEIPEIKYSESYQAKDYTMAGVPECMAYAAHVVTRQIIDDPIIQGYILCKKTYPSEEESPVRESALDILKKRYASGEITKEQFEQMKKDIQ